MKYNVMSLYNVILYNVPEWIFSKSALNTASRKRLNPYIFGNAEITILDPIRFRTDNLYQ